MYQYYDPCDPYTLHLLSTAHVRVLHASPDAPSVDVYVNGSKAVSNLSYKNFTEYLPLTAGTYHIEVYPAGQRSNPVVSRDITVSAQSIYTIAAIGKLNNIALYPIQEPRLDIQENRTNVRFVHLSPDAPAVDIRLPDGKNVFTNVRYKEITNYATVKPGTYTLDVFPTGTNQKVLHVPGIKLKANRFYTVYAVGLVEGDQPLEVLIPLDGNSYL